MDTALILIDIQNDYFPGGKMQLEGSIEAVSNAKSLLIKCRELKIPVIHVQHFSVHSGSTFFIPRTEGVEIHDSVKPIDSEIVIKKNYPNSFRNTSLLDELKKNGIKKLIICGMMTHMCIDATVRAAFDFGFSCIVAGDACATKSLDYDGYIIKSEFVHSAFLAALASVYAKVTTSEGALEILKENNCS
ncbi:MAG: cysteine hydrolase family protein [bacterium]